MRDALIARMREVPTVPRAGQLWVSAEGVPFLIGAVTGIPLGAPDPDYYVVAGCATRAKRNSTDIDRCACMVRVAPSNIIVAEVQAERGELVF